MERRSLHSRPMRCDHCRKSFGLIIHRFWRMRFCSADCLTAYQRRLDKETIAKVRWLDFSARRPRSGFRAMVTVCPRLHPSKGSIWSLPAGPTARPAPGYSARSGERSLPAVGHSRPQCCANVGKFLPGRRPSPSAGAARAASSRPSRSFPVATTSLRGVFPSKPLVTANPLGKWVGHLDLSPRDLCYLSGGRKGAFQRNMWSRCLSF